MLISALAALAMFAAAETTQSGAETAPIAEARPAAATVKSEMRMVCKTVEVSGSSLARKQCRKVPVKAEAPETARPQ